jgi:hypothetical protein
LELMGKPMDESTSVSFVLCYRELFILSAH